MNTELTFGRKILLALLFCGIIFAGGAACAQEITQVKYVNLMYPWVLTMNSNGTAEWNDGSDGQTFTEAKEHQTGSITPAQWLELVKMLTDNGYAEEKPMEGIEPKLRLEIKLSNGKSFTNFGPTVMDDDAVNAFVPIEAFFNAKARELGAPEFDTLPFYKTTTGD